MGSEPLKSVQVKNSYLRTTPSFLGKIVATVNYGDQVRVHSENSDWCKVSLPGKGTEGWIHSSALSNKKIVMKGGGSQAQKTASGEELALAGKGFNKQVEDQYKSRHRSMNFALIDGMEKIVISPDEIKEFLKEGKLNPKGGLL
ncbi:MAG: SH3 domain-containing protein [Pseudomonadota bacterium]